MTTCQELPCEKNHCGEIIIIKYLLHANVEFEITYTKAAVYWDSLCFSVAVGNDSDVTVKMQECRF